MTVRHLEDEARDAEMRQKKAKHRAMVDDARNATGGHRSASGNSRTTLHKGSYVGWIMSDPRAAALLRERGMVDE